jgi:hypothetical protein
MANTERELITTAQAAERLALSIWHVAKLARTGQLPYAQKLPGQKGAYLFDPAVIDQLATERLAKYRKAAARPQLLTTG